MNFLGVPPVIFIFSLRPPPPPKKKIIRYIVEEECAGVGVGPAVLRGGHISTQLCQAQLHRGIPSLQVVETRGTSGGMRACNQKGGGGVERG